MRVEFIAFDEIPFSDVPIFPRDRVKPGEYNPGRRARLQELREAIVIPAPTTRESQ